MRVLITGATGVVGQEVTRALDNLGDAGSLQVTRVARRATRPGDVTWIMGAEPAPDAVRGPWDVVVHAAASTRWSMSRDAAVAANLRPLQAVLDLVDEATHLVHLSTAYVEGTDPEQHPTPSEYGRYRNSYEWSKAEGEELVRSRHRGPLTVVRPPLIIGARADGAIGRFTGPYTLVQTMVSGLAAAVIGEPTGYAELAPVDQVAEVVVAAMFGEPPAQPRTEVIAGGAKSLQLRQLLDVVCDSLNEWRSARGISPVAPPPFIATRRWHRFFLPLAEQHLSEVQLGVVSLLGMFESYTSMESPFEPTQQVEDPAGVLARSIRWWADQKPRLASRIPEPWQIVAS